MLIAEPRTAALSLAKLPHVLREYALLADGERGALVGPRGDVTWMCFPHWDGDPLFASLLGAPAVYAVFPSDPSVWGGYYEPGTLIWHNRWACGGSIAECREALAFPGEACRATLMRRIVASRGPVRVTVVLDMRTDWGRRALTLRRGDDGCWTGRRGSLRVRWTGAEAARPVGDGHALLMEVALEQGQHHDLVLELAEEELERIPGQADALWDATAKAWHRALPDLRHVAAQRDAQQSYALLRGLTGSSGGMVACATTSLPERATEGRDYDYRYVWIRDQAFAGEAVGAAGPYEVLDNAVRFCTERVLSDGPDLRPAYRQDGGPIPDDEEVDLPGYPGAPCVHRGNVAGRQFQLDVFGEYLLLLAAAAEHDRLDATAWQAASVAARAIEQRWQEPDAGVWELEGRLWTHSRLVCVAGLRRLAARGAPPAEGARWLAVADAITAWCSANAIHRDGRWMRAPDDDRVDGALLVPAIRGAIAADDPRTRATLTAVDRELAREGFLYRYRHGGQPLDEAEGAFLLCGFWMALARLQQGDHLGAVHWFERGRTACGPPGLYSEEYDVLQRQMRGNLPQAFVHAVMLECAARLGGVARETATLPEGLGPP